MRRKLIALTVIPAAAALAGGAFFTVAAVASAPQSDSLVTQQQDQTRDRLQDYDGTADQLQTQLRSRDCDPTTVPDLLRDQTQTMARDQVQDQTKDQIREQSRDRLQDCESCGDQVQTREHAQTQEQAGSGPVSAQQGLTEQNQLRIGSAK